MKNQEFTLITDARTVHDLPLDAIFEAGCDDGSPVSRGGVAFVHFDREAPTMAEAIASAIRDLEVGLISARSPYRVVRVDVEENIPMTDEDLRAIERANAGLATARAAATGVKL